MRMSIAVGGMLWLVAMALPSQATLSADFERGLRENSTIYVASRRADGSRSKAAPVWFWWDGKNLYFTTSPDSHKGKRLRRGSVLYFATKSDGPFIEGAPELITDLSTVERMGDEYNKKYWIAWMGFFRPRAERVRDGKTLAIKVTFPDSKP